MDALSFSSMILNETVAESQKAFLKAFPKAYGKKQYARSINAPAGPSAPIPKISIGFFSVSHAGSPCALKDLPSVYKGFLSP